MSERKVNRRRRESPKTDEIQAHLSTWFIEQMTDRTDTSAPIQLPSSTEVATACGVSVQFANRITTAWAALMEQLHGVKFQTPSAGARRLLSDSHVAQLQDIRARCPAYSWDDLGAMFCVSGATARRAITRAERTARAATGGTDE